ncbi:MAG: HAMP domain-containing sensor histidine kinase [Prolixibacteraceae bacterium]|jgi:signal transduction histidine kinase|nr:HAMP domain-containing sensor histidine kinase [Prolixibacteraceae bacterium]
MENIKKYYFLIVSIVVFAAAIFMEYDVMHNQPEIRLTDHFQSTFLLQEKKLDRYMNRIAGAIDSGNINKSYIAEFAYLIPTLETEGLGFLILKQDETVFWSDNHFGFSPSQYRQLKNEKVIFLPNGVFFAKHLTIKNHQIIGLIHLKHKYPFENQYLRNSFVKPFDLPDTYQVSIEESRNSIAVKNNGNNIVFHIHPVGKIRCTKTDLYFPAFLYFTGFILLLFYARRVMKEHREIFILKMLALGAALFSGYWLHVTLGFPMLLKSFSFFGPDYYAGSVWIPSLGDFLLLTSLFFFWSINFSWEFSVSPRRSGWSLVFSFLFSAMMYLFAGYFISDMILNSNISLKLSRISDFDLHSLAAYFSIAFLLFSTFLINQKIVRVSKHFIGRKHFLAIFLPIVILAVALASVFRNVYFFMATLFLLTSLILFLLKQRQTPRFPFSVIVLFVALYSVFSVFIIYKQLTVRDQQIQKLMAVTLSSEHDPVGEVFLAEIQYRMGTDPVIPGLFNTSYDELEDYLIRNYFSGYFSKFDIQTTICTGSDSVWVQPDNSLEPCFAFFDEMIAKSGTKLPGCNFYHMNNMNGRISYLGKLHYPGISDSLGVSIFIELNSKIVSEGIGFPELLMDQSLIKPNKYKDLSYAKYFNNELVNRNGEYVYNSYFLSYGIPPIQKEFQLFRWDSYNHLVYRLGSSNFIVVSNRSLSIFDFLISFPYIFAFYMLFTLVFVFFGNSAYRKQTVPYDLKFKIQAAIISVVLISLIVVAAGTLLYNIQDYNKKHQAGLQEKMRSISEEITSRLADSDEVTPDLHAWLLRELHKLSNVFETDINIYNFNGELMATSRPEMFNRGIIATRMNAQAYYQLVENYVANYFQPEHIGSLSYLSAYEPILNNKGNYMGFLNLPYFTREDNLDQEISTFIVAFINLYVILFLASVIVAVLIANQITRPLSLIRNKLKSIQLGKKSEQINYNAQDEIGALVKEYNKKIVELAESAELLAKTERELAWREMAKQIAHEIKNPLTPMKLHVQYLQRAKKGGMEISDARFEKVTQTLIEQIDNLSDIASGFSNFAKIPQAKNEVIDLVDKLKKVEELFRANPKNKISLQLNGISNLLIYADREQISSAFVNLMKNAIQAIPEDHAGEILIALKKEGTRAVVSISDNGTGIRENLRDRMFEPNFTTKTSGMGLGLAIVKKVVDNLQGRIWYETETDVGTTFYIEIPVYTEK